MNQIIFKDHQLKNFKKKERFPPIRNKSPEQMIHRNSSKKIKNQHNSHFPKLFNKKDLDIFSFSKIQKSIKAPNTKRHKFHTQGMIDGSFSSDTFPDESFISITNHQIQIPQENNDHTLIDFRKKIQQNKRYIKNQIEKKNKQNQQKSNSKSKPYMKRKRVKSSKIIDSSQSKKTIETVDQSYHQPEQKHKNKTLQKRGSQGLFSHLQVILEEKLHSDQKKLFQDKKVKKILDRIKNIKTQKSYKSICDKEIQIKSAQNLKRQTNYKEWQKLQMANTSQISYRRSSFEEELQKISQYTDRNDASLQKYIRTRQELMQIGLKLKKQAKP